MAVNPLPKPKGDWKDLLVSFRPPKFKENHDFYKAFAGRLCMLMAYQMIVAYQLYIVTDYVGLKNKFQLIPIQIHLWLIWKLG